MTHEEEKDLEGEVREKRRNIIWVLLAILMAVGAYAAMLIPALAGQRPEAMSLSGSMLWSAVLFAVVWRHRRKSGWTGAGMGIVFGIIVFAVADFISRFMGAGAGAA